MRSPGPSIGNGFTSIVVPLLGRMATDRWCQELQELRKDFVGYGYRRMTKARKRDGWKINHKRVERVMRQTGLTCRRKPRSVHTTDSKHGEKVVSECDPRICQ